MKMGMVSIISPMYNVEQYIRNFIESIKRQSYENWELLLVDDGSTDRTLDISRKFEHYDHRIRVLRRTVQPKGANACRNIGMDNARGEYIIILDSDDIVEPFCVEQRVNLMKQNKNVDYITVKGGCVAESDDGKLLETSKVYGIDPQKDLICCLLSSQYPFGVWNNIYRNSSVRDCRWDEKVQVYQDFDFMLTTALKGKKHMYANDSVIDYWYRTGRPNAITSSFISESKHESTMYLFKKIYTEIDSAAETSKYKKCFKEYFSLQQARLLINGNEKQIEAFYKLTISCYKDIRFRIMHCLLAKPKSCRKRKRTVNLVQMLLFQPKMLISVCINKMKNVRI